MLWFTQPHQWYKVKDLSDLRDHIDNRFDKLDDKLTSHLDRISKTEESIIWLKGHVKISTTLLITIIGVVVSYILTLQG